MRRAVPGIAAIEEGLQLPDEEFDPIAQAGNPVEEVRCRHPQLPDDVPSDLGREGGGRPEVVGDRSGSDIGSPGDVEHRRPRDAPLLVQRQGRGEDPTTRVGHLRSPLSELVLPGHSPSGSNIDFAMQPI